MIKGLSDIRRLRRVGKIHLGVKAKAQSGNLYPKAVDYFVVKADESTPESAAAAFKAVYGDNPKELEIMFPVDAAHIFWDCFYKSYVRTQTTGGKLICKGDGVTANRLNMQSGELEEIPCPGPDDCEYAQPESENKPLKCKRVGTLQFLIPKVEILGVWQIDTSSFNGIVSLNSDIDMIRSVTGGRLAMIPLVLKVVPKKCMVEGKQSIIHHLTVEWRGELKQLIALGQQKRGQLAYQVEPLNQDEIPTDLIPQETVPLIGKDLAPAAAPAAQPAQAAQAAQQPGQVQEAEAEFVDQQHQEEAELSQHEIFVLAQKGMSSEAGKALRASMDTTAEFIKYLGTLPDKAKAAPAAKPAQAPAHAAKPAAPAPAAAKPAAPAVNLLPQINAEFARLKWSQVKIDGMMRAYPDKAKLLTILKGAK